MAKLPTQVVRSPLLERLQQQSLQATPILGEALLLLLDGSTSMATASGGTTAWQELRRAVQVLVSASDPALCRIGLVTFASTADLLVPFTEDLFRVSMALVDSPPGGATKMKDGLILAQDLSWPAAKVRRLVLLSDGMATSGDPVPTAQILGKLGIVLDTVGCGGGVDEETLKSIAMVGGGRYTHCSEIQYLTTTFLALETRARGLLR